MLLGTSSPLRSSATRLSAMPSSSSSALTVSPAATLRRSPLMCRFMMFSFTVFMCTIITHARGSRAACQPYGQANDRAPGRHAQPVRIAVPDQHIDQNTGRNQHVVHGRQLAGVDAARAQVPAQVADA